ncbi:hypothetical protein [Paracoccus tibetensis]|uniref:Uncharacterized protein n=1 Tax=Paracoccus tibetensis TaxID=336292 RepID=A0A1G5D7D2_9RHOB|nr:hypothetical protein [Paracoccus tibetensis]SCY10749.1 hypothetical protein SAMN05660710_00701 [Paracoccus tibetensis]
MNPEAIGLACLLGAGVIAFGSARLRLAWPVAVLALLLAAISGQLYMAAQGQGGFHDLGALIAQGYVTAPALLGALAGLVLARIAGHALRWRSLSGGLAGLGLIAAGLGVAASFGF